MSSQTQLDIPLGLAACAALLGASSHLAVFIRGEWEKHVLTLATIQLFGPILLFATLYVPSGAGFYNAALTTASLVIGFHTGLFGSMTIYRVFFHPLRSFYGPTGAKITTFWSVMQNVPDFKLYSKLQRLHQEHGDFIRFRPREISINDAEAVQQVYGLSSKCSKGPFYDLNYPSRSLQMTRDKKFHSQRRRIWDKAFTAKAMKDYEQRLMMHFDDFCALINASKGKPMNATTICEYWGFDVMGDLMFGRSFSMLKDNKPNFALEMFQKTKPVNGILLQNYWTFMLLQRLPIVATVRSNWLNWCKAQLDERRVNIPKVADLYSYLLGDKNEKAGKILERISDGDAASDSELAIVAGSDTSSGTLAAIIYLLAKHRDVQQRVHQEIVQAFAANGGFSHQALVNKPLLEGIINEALRLWTPVPTGLQRVTPEEGAVIAGRFIPGDTLVSVPTWTVHHDPRNFQQPNDFIPERWSSRPELVLRKEAFIPFSAGPYSCVGKPLAMMELRLAVANVVTKFDMKLEDEVESVKTFEESPGWKDTFVVSVPPVRVCFQPRD